MRYEYTWPFQLAAVLILVFALGVSWWAAILVTLLAGMSIII